jgi:hypothetical protein
MVLRGNLPATAPEQTATATADQAALAANPTTTEPAAAANEPAYICGARTKKGTPCSRRVRFPGRCYQHKGMPAMLPEDQLLVKG